MFSLRRFISIVAVSVDLRFLGTFLSESVLWLAGSSFGPYSWESRTAAHEPLSKSGVQLVGFTWFRAEGLGFGEPGHPYWGASGWMFFFPFSHHFEAFVFLKLGVSKNITGDLWILLNFCPLTPPVDTCWWVGPRPIWHSCLRVLVPISRSSMAKTCCDSCRQEDGRQSLICFARGDCTCSMYVYICNNMYIYIEFIRIHCLHVDSIIFFFRDKATGRLIQQCGKLQPPCSQAKGNPWRKAVVKALVPCLCWLFHGKIHKWSRNH